MSNDITVAITTEDLKGGQRYEDRYGHYLEIFQRISVLIDAGKEVSVVGAPWSWVPLLKYMGATNYGPVIYFASADSVAHAALTHAPAEVITSRTSIEALCALRPETVDALWKVDRQWKTKIRFPLKPEKEFIVTSNGSFDRPEIQAYELTLNAHVPTKQKVVLVPCAADKPYPARMHQAVLDIMPGDFYLANVTGVLGIVPQSLWPYMPHYDSGIPNEWRAMQTLLRYFGKHTHTDVIVYCDFYSLAIHAAFYSLGPHKPKNITYVNPVQFYPDYLDLLDPARLDKLKKAFEEES